jgi:hypothetical protein
MARQIDWDNETTIQSVMVDMTKHKLVEFEPRDREARRGKIEAQLRTFLGN